MRDPSSVVRGAHAKRDGQQSGFGWLQQQQQQQGVWLQAGPGSDVFACRTQWPEAVVSSPEAAVFLPSVPVPPGGLSQLVFQGGCNLVLSAPPPRVPLSSVSKRTLKPAWSLSWLEGPHSGSTVACWRKAESLSRRAALTLGSAEEPAFSALRSARGAGPSWKRVTQKGASLQ